ncbi:Phosphoribosylformylglycinamidine synthase 2 [Rickettsiales bacterium Ac37b]|nr:Phosphoribosylformylglycinamidine synthase 2 [Rickettsiales bacterium Ac37b]
MMNLEEINKDVAKELGLSNEEYEKILEILGRKPNYTELGIFTVMWSEHCSYKSTKLHLRKLPTEAEWVICGPGENAGVIDIGEGKAIIFKMESHNHPSFIEPYQGAATGVGGIMRDVFTMGARPIANLNSLRFGDFNHPKTKYLLAGVAAGIGGYGNAMGIPTVGGECTFHSSYNGNILVNAMTVGIADQDKIFYSKASIPGTVVVYVGSKTGRDGIHGATMASASFDDLSEQKRPTVQVGDPFAEKLLLEACLELMSKDAILGIQDMGAAGLTCASLEMAGKGGTGIELDLDKVPVRDPKMIPYEIMLSESQERMLMVLKPECVEMAYKIFAKWGLDFAVVGTITTTGRLILKAGNQVVGDIPIDPLHENSPEYDRSFIQPIPRKDIKIDINIDHNINDILLKLLASPDLCAKNWIYEQYDSTVGASTISGPGGDAAVLRINANKALAMTSDCTPRYCAADPYGGAKQAVVENWRNLICVGSKPLAITDCLNFGNPEKPEIMGQIVACIEGMAEACKVLKFPVISGNVSLYNETNDKAIYPTPTVGSVGLIEDIDKLTRNCFQKANDTIVLLGKTEGHLGASLFLREIYGEEDGQAPSVNLFEEKKYGEFILHLIKHKMITACHDVSDGGLYISLAEMAMKSNIGAIIQIPSNVNKYNWLFGEDQCRYIITCNNESLSGIEKLIEEHNIYYQILGKTGGDKIQANDEEITLDQLKLTYNKSLSDKMS